MLQVKSTANHTGVIISGNHDDLSALCSAFANVIGDEDDYVYNGASCLRLSGICNEIRHACQGEGEASDSSHGLACYAFRVLWPEIAFIAAILDNFVLLSIARKLYAARLPDALKTDIQFISPNDIALIHYFQDLVWNELERIVGHARLRAIFGKFNDLRAMHFKYPQFDGFYTQWLDLLNMKLLCSKPEQRCSDLVTILASLFSMNEDYLSLKNTIDALAKQEGVYVAGIKLADCMDPETIKW